MATLHRVDGSFEVPAVLPVIALRDLVFFPYMVLPLLVGRPKSLAALEEAEAGDGLALLLAQRDPAADDPDESGLHRAGTVIRVMQVSHLADGTARVVMEGLGRARADSFKAEADGFRARVRLLSRWEYEPDPGPDAELDERVAEVSELFREYARLSEHVPGQVAGKLAEIGDRVRLAHLIAGHLLVGTGEKQELLEADDSPTRFVVLREILVRENEILRIQAKIDEEIRLGGGRKGRPATLEEQLDALGAGAAASDDPEWAEMERVIAATPLPAHARDRVDREFDRLQKLGSVTPEASVIRTYLDWILGLPWERETADNLDVGHAAAVLEAEHHGLEEVKERILDHIAVLSLVGKLQGPILCLVGPPGVGKTSLGRSIARCLDRKFVRVSLGGVRDEAEIRGHRRTYVGALPGRVLQGVRKGESRNPVFLLDELDKLARDFHGDPGAALLEVLDPEQNRSFADHYLELEFDLSHVLFIATANTLGGVPAPLRDRMEVIRLPGYLDTEKRVIARRFLWPKQVRRHGIEPWSPGISGEAVQRVIAEYTREAGVRELERRLSRVARKLARSVTPGGEGRASGEIGSGGDVGASGDAASGPRRLRRVEAADLRELLGPPAHLPSRREDGTDRYGIACGLAWTAAGGEVLDVEVAVVPGSGKVQLTGTLGDVMKESAFAALTYARSRARRMGLPEQFHKDVDIHIHIPEGATPKDGPSAGITIATALISALTDRPTRAAVAMTGEITLRGRVLVVGGIKEKAVAALRGGIKRVILPARNALDVEQLPEEVLAGVEMVPLETMDEVLREALAPGQFGGSGRAGGRAPAGKAAAGAGARVAAGPSSRPGASAVAERTSAGRPA